MITIRRSLERGHANHGWLNTYHTFSFANYHDSNHMRFRALRVMNEDWVEPGMGFGTHPHDNMEIITYVLEGELEHKDSLGNGSFIKAGDVQVMSAGTGVTHSEYNPSKTNRVHLYQIWIFPQKKGANPRYEQQSFNTESKLDRLQLVVSGDGRDGSLSINQDASILLGALNQAASLRYELSKERYVWLQIIKGAGVINGHKLSAGDGAAISEEREIDIRAETDAEVMLIELG